MTVTNLKPQNDLIQIKRRKLGRIPSKIGGLLDRYFQLDQQKKALEKETAQVKSEISGLEELIFAKFKKEDIHGTRGKFCQATANPQIVPVAEDWEAIYKYIAKGKNRERFDLLQKRLAVTAIRERWENNVKIPGVGSFEKMKLSVRKIKG